MGILPWEIRAAFPGESQLRQSRAIRPIVHARCFSVSIIYRTLTWTKGSLTCAQMLMHAIAHGGVRAHVKESALKVDFERKITCRTEESNLRQRRDGPTLYQLSYIPIPSLTAWVDRPSNTGFRGFGGKKLMTKGTVAVQSNGNGKSLREELHACEWRHWQ